MVEICRNPKDSLADRITVGNAVSNDMDFSNDMPVMSAKLGSIQPHLSPFSIKLPANPTPGRRRSETTGHVPHSHVPPTVDVE